MDKKSGYLIIAHGRLGAELLDTLEFIGGKQDQFGALALDHGIDFEKAREIIADEVAKVAGPEGVIIFTDLFGGAPSNVAMTLIDEKKIEIVAGVNLPMLLCASTLEDDITLTEKAARLAEYGKNNIFLASDLLSSTAKKNGHK